MAVGVVDLFEVVEIEVHQAETLFAARGDGVIDLVLYGVTVRQAGDEIGVGQHP